MIAFVALSCGGGGCALAEGAPQPRVVHAIDKGPYRLWRESWGGGDMLANSWSVYSGTTIALSGDIEDPGWRLRSTGGYGRYSYRKWTRGLDGPEFTKFTGHNIFSDVLLGYQTQWQTMTLKVFGGVTSDRHIVDPRDPDAAVSGFDYGGKAQMEAWVQLSRRHWIAADASYATSFDTYKTGLRSGYQVLDALDLGIEARFEGNDDYMAARAGGFATVRVGDGGVTAAAGISGDRDQRKSPYATLSVFFRY